MHRKIVFFFVALLYYGIGAYGLYQFNAGLLVTSLVFYAVPAWVLARVSQAPATVIIAVSILGAGLACLFEAIANLYGLWYTVGSDVMRVFGLISFEAIVAITVQTIFYALLYEVLFDDGSYTVRTARERIGFLLVFLIGSVTLVALHTYLLQDVFLSYSYLWIVGSIMAVSFTMLALHKNLSVHFFDRTIDFALVAAIPTIIGVWVGAHNVHRVYGYPDAYLGTVKMFDVMLPIDEIVLAIAVPLMVAIIYELYVDDRY